MNDTEWLAYIAGLFDGEGTFGLYRHNSNSPCVQATAYIANTNKEILEEVRDVLGYGTVYNGRAGTEKWKPLYRLEFSQKETEWFIDDVGMYLRIKKEQSKVLKEFFTLRKRIDAEKKIELSIKLKALNKTGPKEITNVT